MLIRPRENTMDSLISVDQLPQQVIGAKKMHVRSFSRYEYYLLGQAISGTNWVRPLASNEQSSTNLSATHTPEKGLLLKLPDGMPYYCNTLVLHEGKQVDIKGDTLYINGKATQHCYFTKDYYWMAKQ